MSSKDAQNLYGQKMGQKGARTRARLMQATAALIEKRSIRDLKVTEITAFAGLSNATFYIYFDDVTDVVLALALEVKQITPVIEELLAQPWAPEDALRNARVIVQAYMSFWDQHQAVLRLRNLAAEEGDKRFREARHQATLSMFNMICERIEASGFPVDSNSMATLMMTMLERIPAITRLPATRSRPKLMDAAAFLLASLIAPGSTSLLAEPKPAGRKRKPGDRASGPSSAEVAE